MGLKIKSLFKKIAGAGKEGDPKKELLKIMPPNAVCAEIGVWKGDFSKQILKINKPQKLHLIDPWQYQPDYSNRIYGGKVAKTQVDMDKIFHRVKKSLEKFPEVIFHRDFSDRVAGAFEDEYFDWIYIDGNHYYEYVLDDLKNYYPKVKKGGIIAGDDYEWTSEELEGDRPVKRAVEDFLDQHKGKIHFEKILDSQFILKKEG